MRAAERDAEMARFRDGELDVLVGTTVLEVGVDVPDATVMIVLDADRFGLAQLHQLRGRVGRGTAASYCVLVADVPRGQRGSRTPQGPPRPDDGFALAELDCELRGEGEVLGLTQSGLPPLRVAAPRRRASDQRAVGARRRHAEDLLDAHGRLRPRARAPSSASSTRAGWPTSARARALGGRGIDA